MNHLIVLSAIVLLPLIPAFILFHTLKSSAQVDGPMGGLKVSLGGAFGGYVALTVFIATYFAHMPHATTWHVKGELHFPDGVTPSVVTCDVHPPEFQMLGRNRFNIDLPIGEDGALPTLVINANGYPSETIDLSEPGSHVGGPGDPSQIGSDPTIHIKKSIVFQKPGPAYNPPVRVAEGGPK